MIRHHAELKCDVRAIFYDFASRQGVIHIDDGDCTDMTGCITLFRRIDPGVTQIQTIAGGRDDTRYAQRGGQWVAK